MRFVAYIISVTVLVSASTVCFRMTSAMSNHSELQADKNVISGINEFAVDLYRSLDSHEGNIFFSPFSISAALAMTYAGARGETQTQMATTLRFPQDPVKVHSTFAALNQRFNDGDTARRYQLSVANALWGEKSIDFRGDFVETLRTSYGANLNRLDFSNAPDESRLKINAWVEKQTRDKIHDLLTAGSITNRDRLVLTNAIYFKGDWENQFKKSLSALAPFFRFNESQSNAVLMHQTGSFKYLEMDGYQLLDMPYAGGELSMSILLPKSKDGLGQLEHSLNGGMLTPTGLTTRKVEVYIPKFKLEQTFELNSTLAKLGMSSAFSEAADFSGLDGKRDLNLSLVIHKAFVDVDERGTEAAAATGVVATLASARPQKEEIPVFRADHPFIFLIRDNRSDSILFIGRIVNPD